MMGTLNNVSSIRELGNQVLRKSYDSNYEANEAREVASKIMVHACRRQAKSRIANKLKN